ncbi:unnamed protein product [Schistosoma intercalatum]|nr:unnamed protein product [Schistosoma intercalatum]
MYKLDEKIRFEIFVQQRSNLISTELLGIERFVKYGLKLVSIFTHNCRICPLQINHNGPFLLITMTTLHS